MNRVAMSRMSTINRLAITAVVIASACMHEPQAHRGPGLQVDTLDVTDLAAVYRATLAGSFRLDDPNLALLVDPMLLPRGAGLARGDTMPSGLLSALQRDGLVRGTCSIPIQRTRVPLICRADRAGYVVRFSAPLALGPRHDSVQVYLVVQQYAIPGGPAAERLRFERAYHLVRRESTWRAVREARLPQP
jgi:hypothetical protein